LAAQWSDDFHHALHALLTHEAGGYYADFGSMGHLGSTFRKGWFYEGQYSRFRRRNHGNSPEGISRPHFVVCSQNHDQVGNRARGERLSSLVNFEAQKLAAGVTLLSPFVPLLFMGEEYGEKVPFQYFTSHGDEHLIEAVRRGRREEFVESGWDADPPDPQDCATFEDSKLHHALRDQNPHRTLRLLYQELMRFRRANHLGADADLTITENESLQTLTLLRRSSDSTLLMLFNLGAADIEIPHAMPGGQWLTELNSADSQWLGPDNPRPPIVSPGGPIAISGQSFLVLRKLRQDGGF
jgi:maltooligosyltrehalose trehalohydrolase